MSASHPRLLVIGLDGATWEMMSPMMAAGELPTLRRLMKEGVSGMLRSTIPPVTAPAWSGFMTGLNPGKHGIFQWRTYDPTTYTCLDERLMTSQRLAGRTFWDLLGEAGYRVGVVTVPMTYPTWAVNGYLLAGYPCPDAQLNYAYPADWEQALDAPYNFQADYYLHASETEIWQGGLDMLARRTDLAIDLMQNKGVDVCVVVLGEIDRAQHDFFQYAAPRFPQYHTPAGERFRDVIAEHYRVSDEQVGRMLAAAGPDTTVLVMSDHGAGPHPPKYFNTNAWLQSQGWLRRRAAQSAWREWLRRGLSVARKALPFEERLRRLLPARFVNSARSLSMNIADVDWPATAAYRFPMYHPAEGIEINLKGRQPQGVIDPGAEFESLRQAIMEALTQLVDPATGELVVREVYRREDLYLGPYAEIAPDIVFITNEDYRGNGGSPVVIEPAPLGQMDQYNGLHRMEGILLASGPGLRQSATIEGAMILDIAPTLLHTLGEGVPRVMDGRILMELFADPAPPRYTDQADVGPGASVGLSAAEDEDMRNKLRGLGYVE